MPDKIQRKRHLAKSYQNRKVKVLPDLNIGQEVRLAPTQRQFLEIRNLCKKALRQIIPGRDSWRSIPAKQAGRSRKPQLLTMLTNQLRKMLRNHNPHQNHPVTQLLRTIRQYEEQVLEMLSHLLDLRICLLESVDFSLICSAATCIGFLL